MKAMMPNAVFIGFTGYTTTVSFRPSLFPSQGRNPEQVRFPPPGGTGEGIRILLTNNGFDF
jgi:hypothetical protein